MTATVAIEIDQALCNGCGECLIACEPQALAMREGKAFLLHPELCKYDAGCEPACPVGAIGLPFLVVFAPETG